MGPTAMRKVLGTPGASRQRKRGRARNPAARVREQSAGLAQFRDTRSVRTIVAVVLSFAKTPSGGQVWLIYQL